MFEVWILGMDNVMVFVELVFMWGLCGVVFI